MSEEDESKVAAATTEAEAEGEGGEHEEGGVHKEEESTATFEPIVSGDGRRLTSQRQTIILFCLLRGLEKRAMVFSLLSPFFRILFFSSKI